jgi:hypothetical protein
MPRIFQFYVTSRLALQVSFGVPLGILRYIRVLRLSGCPTEARETGKLPSRVSIGPMTVHGAHIREQRNRNNGMYML